MVIQPQLQYETAERLFWRDQRPRLFEEESFIMSVRTKFIIIHNAKRFRRLQLHGPTAGKQPPRAAQRTIKAPSATVPHQKPTAKRHQEKEDLGKLEFPMCIIIY